MSTEHSKANIDALRKIIASSGKTRRQFAADIGISLRQLQRYLATGNVPRAMANLITKTAKEIATCQSTAQPLPRQARTSVRTHTHAQNSGRPSAPVRLTHISFRRSETASAYTRAMSTARG